MNDKEFDEIKEYEILKNAFYVFFAVLVLAPIMMFKYLFIEPFSTFLNLIFYLAAPSILALSLVICLVQFLLLKKRLTGDTVKLCSYLLITCGMIYLLYIFIDSCQQDFKQNTIVKLRNNAADTASKLICVKPKNAITHALTKHDESGLTQKELLDVLYEDIYSNRNKYISNKRNEITAKLDEFIAQQNLSAYMSDDDKEGLINELKKIATKDIEIELNDDEYMQILKDYARAASVLDELQKRHKYCLYNECQKVYYDYDIRSASVRFHEFEDFMRICKYENK